MKLIATSFVTITPLPSRGTRLLTGYFVGPRTSTRGFTVIAALITPNTFAAVLIIPGTTKCQGTINFRNTASLVAIMLHTLQAIAASSLFRATVTRGSVPATQTSILATVGADPHTSAPGFAIITVRVAPFIVGAILVIPGATRGGWVVGRLFGGRGG